MKETPGRGSGALWQNGVCAMGPMVEGWRVPSDISLPVEPGFGGKFSSRERERAVWYLLAAAQRSGTWVWVSWPRLVCDILKRTNSKEFERDVKAGAMLRRFTLEPNMPEEGQTLRMFCNSDWGASETHELAHGLRGLIAAKHVFQVQGAFHDVVVDAFGLSKPVVDLLARKSPADPFSDVSPK